jgi:hypothetical protein
MRRITAGILAILLSLCIVVQVSAQASETIWLTAPTTTYKTGETVIVTVNAASATPIQGFTFQIRYDTACLRPVNASSPVPGMNGLPLPQLIGFVDGSYASTSPQIVNGVLAEVRFTALKGCQTSLTLDSAALAIRSAEGFAAPLPGVTLGARDIALNIDNEVGASQPAQQDSGAILPLDPPEPTSGIPGWILGVLAALVIALLVFGGYKVFRSANTNRIASTTSPRRASLHMKQGPQAGKSFVLNKLPFAIGRDPQNDICLNDPLVISRHAQIYSDANGYYLRDMGGGTLVNDHPVRDSAVVLYPGDVVRVGRSALFVFG